MFFYCVQTILSQFVYFSGSNIPISSESHKSFQSHFFTKIFFFIEVYLIYNVVLVSGVQQSDSVIHTYLSLLFQILFPYRLLQDIEHNSLCYTVGPCLFYIQQCVSNPKLLIYPSPTFSFFFNYSGLYFSWFYTQQYVQLNSFCDSGIGVPPAPVFFRHDIDFSLFEPLLVILIGVWTCRRKSQS